MDSKEYCSLIVKQSQYLKTDHERYALEQRLRDWVSKYPSRQDLFLSQEDQLWVQYNLALVLGVRLEQTGAMVSFLERCAESWKLIAEPGPNVVEMIVESVARNVWLVLTSKIEWDGAVPRLLFLLVGGYLVLGLVDKSHMFAEEFCRDIPEFSSGSSSKSLRSAAMVLYIASYCNFLKSNFNRALYLCERASSIDASFHPAVFLTAHLKMRAGDLEVAKGLFRRVSIHYRTGVSINNEGCCSHKLGDISNAIDRFRIAVGYAEASRIAAFNVALIHLENGSLQDAMLILKAMEETAESLESHAFSSVLLKHIIAGIHLEQKDPRAAVLLLEQLIEETRETSPSPSFWRDYIFALLENEMNEVALSISSEALLMYPDDVELLLLQCDSQFSLGRFKEAKQTADRTLHVLALIEKMAYLDCESGGARQIVGNKRKREWIPELPDNINGSVGLGTTNETILENEDLRQELIAQAFNQKAMVLIRLEQLEDAVKQFRCATNHRPQNCEAQYNLALALWQQDEKVKACVHWLRFRHIQLDLLPQQYAEKAMNIRSRMRPVIAVPHLSGTVSEDCLANLDVLLLDEWSTILRDKEFRTALNQISTAFSEHDTQERREVIDLC